jgi:hypothetical protein
MLCVPLDGKEDPFMRVELEKIWTRDALKQFGR